MYDYDVSQKKNDVQCPPSIRVRQFVKKGPNIGLLRGRTAVVAVAMFCCWACGCGGCSATAAAFFGGPQPSTTSTIEQQHDQQKQQHQW